jgi:hypothetical protein
MPGVDSETATSLTSGPEFLFDPREDTGDLGGDAVANLAESFHNVCFATFRFGRIRETLVELSSLAQPDGTFFSR